MDSAALPPASHEVIVISDDEDNTTEETSATSSSVGSYSWSAVADQLLALTKHSDVRADQHILEALLRDIGAPSSIDLRRHLQVTCERLRELLQLSKSHARRYRANEELVLVICEVLSLAQTLSVQEPQKAVKEEMQQGLTIDDLLQLMDKWSGMLRECSRTSLLREQAFGSTITRLEKLKQLSINDAQRFAGCAAERKAKREKAAQQWKNVLDKCSSMMDHQPEPFGCKIVAFEAALEMTKHDTSAFYKYGQEYAVLLQKSKEMETRREFFDAALQLTFTIAGLPNLRDEQDEEGCAKLMLLENDIMATMDGFCCGLRNAVESIESSAQLSFATQFKLFWLIRRNWLRPVVLDVVFARLDALLMSSGQNECSLRTAISRVCAGIKAA